MGSALAGTGGAMRPAGDGLLVWLEIGGDVESGNGDTMSGNACVAKCAALLACAAA